MDEFLARILPSTGIYFSAFIDADGKVFHKGFNTINELARFMEWADHTGKFNVYHACASYKQLEYVDPVSGKKKRRTQENTRAMRSFWADIDVDPSGKKPYSFLSKSEALHSLAAFCNEAKMPAPLIVDSGNGIHAYWPLKDEVLSANWRPYADMLKKAMIAQGMIVDPSRGADGASVLRTPGMINRGKSFATALPVRILRDRAPLSNDLVFDRILAAGKMFKLDAAKHLSKTTKAFAEGYEQSSVQLIPANDSPPANAKKIADACAQINDMRATKGCVSEPVWYATVGLLSFCEDGENLAQEWSSGHPDYSPARTLEKMKQWSIQTTGPATCAYFNDKSGNSKCSTCAFRGKISSPIQLGTVLKEAVKADEVGNEIIPPPFPYSRAADGIHVCIDKIANITKKVYAHDIYISDIIRHSAGYEVAIVNYNRPNCGWQTLQAKTSIFNKKDTCWEWFTDNGIYIPHEETAVLMGLYMRSYLAELHSRREALVSFDSLGWKDDGSFLAGQIHITPSGEMKQNKIIGQTIPVAKHFGPKGSLEKWSAVTDVFNNTDNLEQGFGFLVGAGSPLLKFTGLGGFSVNLVGETGFGKSSILRLINSMFGQPQQLMLTAKDSHLATIHRFGIYNNICACIDEIGNKEAKGISDLVLQATQGVDRLTLTQQRKEREAKQWNLMIMLSSNHRLLPKVSDIKSNSDAEAMRLFEIEILRSEFFSDAAKAKEFNEVLEQNYGKAGLLLMKYVVANPGRLKTMLNEASAILSEKGITFTAQERFIAAAFYVAYCMGVLMTELKLIRFDYMACITAAYKQVEANRIAFVRDKLDVFDLVSAFVNQNFDKIISIEYGRHDRPVVVHDTRGGEIMGRIEVVRGHKNTIVKGTLSLSMADLKLFLNTRMSSIGEFRRDLLNARALLADSQAVTLGKGSQYQTPSTRSMVINMMHPRLVSALSEDSSEIMKQEQLYERIGLGDGIPSGGIRSELRH